MLSTAIGLSFRRIQRYIQHRIQRNIQRKKDKAYRQRWAAILRASGTIK